MSSKARDDYIAKTYSYSSPKPTPKVTQTQTNPGGNFGGYSNEQQQYAASVLDIMDQDKVIGGNLGLGSSGALFETNVPGVYYSSYVPGTQSYSPTGYVTLSGPGALYENGELIEGYVDRGIYNPYGGGFGGGGGGFNYGYGRGGGGGGGGFGYSMNMGMIGQPRQRAQVGPGSLQEQVNQAFLSGGKPFAKGGIVSLVED